MNCLKNDFIRLHFLTYICVNKSTDCKGITFSAKNSLFYEVRLDFLKMLPSACEQHAIAISCPV